MLVFTYIVAEKGENFNQPLFIHQVCDTEYLPSVIMFDPNALIRFYKQCLSIRKTAKQFAVHRSTVYRWIIKARSTVPRYLRHTGLKRSYKPPSFIRSRVLAAEEQLEIGLTREQYGWCAERITLYLKKKGKLRTGIGSSTVYRLLKAKGMIEIEGNHRRPKFQDTLHMHLKNAKTIGKLQMDVKYVTPALSGLPHTTFKYAIIDIFSRYKMGVILPTLDMNHAIQALALFLKEMPFKPDFIQTDNGFEFQSRFSEFCKKSGLQHHLIHKSSPNENAVIERSFRTDEEEFYFRLPQPPADLEQLNVWYQHYLEHYNTERIHLGLGMQTPAEIVANLSD